MIGLHDKWIWDSWYIREGERWHAFFLQAERAIGDPDLRHWNASVGHAVGEDLTDWTYLGTCFRPSVGPAWDDCATWTGSVVRGPDAVWHLFYTGSSRAEDGARQRIGHATSRDLHAWERSGDGLALDIDPALYEEYTPGHWHDRAFRDPWVMADPAGDGWLMYFTARAPGVAEPNAGGVIGLATSPDLATWTLERPVYAGGAFGQMEVPQVFAVGGHWYCLFCTDRAHWSRAYAARYPGSPVTGTHYLIAADPRGPWELAPGPFLDGSHPCHRYAARIVGAGRDMRLLGFLHTGADGRFVGAISDPVPVEVGADGDLRLVGAGSPIGPGGGSTRLVGGA